MTGGKTELAGFPRDLTLRAQSIQPEFREILVQNSMDWFSPTGQVLKKLVYLLRWTTFPGLTGRKFGWMDRTCKCFSTILISRLLLRMHHMYLGSIRWDFHQECMECKECNLSSRLDLISLVIWSCVFWPSITWNLCKVQRWSKSVLTFDRYRPHYIMFLNFQFNNDKNKERSKTILVVILLYKKTTLILKTAEWITVEGLVSGHPWDSKKLSFYNWSWPLMGM